jgi:hypothetical protein
VTEHKKGAYVGGVTLHTDKFVDIVRAAISDAQSEGNSASRLAVAKI